MFMASTGWIHVSIIAYCPLQGWLDEYGKEKVGLGSFVYVQGNKARQTFPVQVKDKKCYHVLGLRDQYVKLQRILIALIGTPWQNSQTLSQAQMGFL